MAEIPRSQNLIVIGQERCGTHTLTDMIIASGEYAIHEANPTLCKESFQRVMNEIYSSKIINEKINNLSIRHEANHRLQFFCDIIADKLPETKFLFLIRNPVSLVKSLIGTFAHWEGMKFPDWYYEQMKIHIPNNKNEFNEFRIPSKKQNRPLPILHISSICRGMEYSLVLMEKIENRLKILKTEDIPNKSKIIWEWSELEWNDKVQSISQKRKDSIYECRNSQLLDWINIQSQLYCDDIKEEFRNCLTKYEIGKIILKELKL